MGVPIDPVSALQTPVRDCGETSRPLGQERPTTRTERPTVLGLAGDRRHPPRMSNLGVLYLHNAFVPRLFWL